MHVTAKDLATGKEEKLTITAPHRLSKQEIERMVKDAEQFAEQDRLRREEAEIRNLADSLIYTAEKTKADLKDKLTNEQVEKINRSINELREALSGKDAQKIKTKNEELSKVLQEIGAGVYRQAAQQQAQREGPQPEQSSKTGEDKGKVVDAEYEVVDDKK